MHPVRAMLVLLAGVSCGNEVTVVPGGGGAAPGPTATSSSSPTTPSTTPGPSSELPCGPGHPPCPPDEYCERADDCGKGLCLNRPGNCPDACPGVCGCDGQTYCNDCQAQSQGVDVGPGELCLGSADVEYRALLWLGGMDHLIVMRADYTNGTCLRLYADWPSTSAYDIDAPPDWGVGSIVASDGTAGCLDDPPPPGPVVAASAASGVLQWQLEPGMYYPCQLDLEALVFFAPAPAWLGGEVAMSVAGLDVEGGCL